MKSANSTALHQGTAQWIGGRCQEPCQHLRATANDLEILGELELDHCQKQGCFYRGDATKIRDPANSLINGEFWNPDFRDTLTDSEHVAYCYKNAANLWKHPLSVSTCLQLWHLSSVFWMMGVPTNFSI